jgi:hypothetical protein
MKRHPPDKWPWCLQKKAPAHSHPKERADAGLYLLLVSGHAAQSMALQSCPTPGEIYYNPHTPSNLQLLIRCLAALCRPCRDGNSALSLASPSPASPSNAEPIELCGLHVQRRHLQHYRGATSCSFQTCRRLGFKCIDDLCVMNLPLYAICSHPLNLGQCGVDAVCMFCRLK